MLIADRLLIERFVRSSGPGGQNVNKVATAVELRFNLPESALADDVKERLRQLAGSRLTSDGWIVIEARENRTQGQNREAARARLEALVAQALRRPRKRHRTKPTVASRERRLEGKSRRAAIKRARRQSQDD